MRRCDFISDSGTSFRPALRRPAHAVVVTMMTLCGLAGCDSTERQVLQSQIDLHKDAIVESHKTLDTLTQNGGGPGPYQVKAYVSVDLVNRALAKLQGLQIPIPGVANTTATLNSLQLSRYGSFPVVNMSASAEKGSLKVQANLAAAVIPTGRPGEMKFHVLSFVPDVEWFWFELTKARFVRDLLTVQLDKLADQLPAVELPTQGTVALGGPDFHNVVRFKATDRPSYITIDMHFPATAWNPTVQNARYYYLGQGIYMFGDIP
jgi:hypothetical protein